MPSTPTRGPRRVPPDNPRYFADSGGKAVYLPGAHPWNSLKIMAKTDPPPPFDFAAYLDFLQTCHHNFIRLWTWELARYSYDGEPVFARKGGNRRPAVRIHLSFCRGCRTFHIQ